MPQDATSLLAARILHDKQITYRVLSRQMNIHVDEAKRLLYAFHEDHPSPKTHATYLIAGSRTPFKSEPVANGHSTDANGDSTMNDTMAEDSTLTGVNGQETETQTTIEQFAYVLAQEQELEAIKATFVKIDCIHVYSLEPGRLHDMSILVSVNDTVHTDAALVKNWKTSNNGAFYGVIQQSNRKAVEKTASDIRKESDRAFAVASTSKDKAKPKGAAPEKPTAKETKPDVKKSFFEAKPSNKRKSSALEETDKKPPTKTTTTTSKEPPNSNNKGKGKAKAEISSSDAMELDEQANEQEKIRLEQEQADLEAMMAEPWDDDIEMDSAPAKAASQTKTKGESSKSEGKTTKSQAKDSESAPENEKTAKKRVRKTRKVKKTVTDEKGYKSKVEAEESYYETESDEEKPKPKAKSTEKAEKPKEKAKAPPPKKKPIGKPGEQTSMKSFFKK